VANVRVEIVRYTDDHQPGFVECHLSDVAGRVWSFEEKVPVVTVEDLSTRPASIHGPVPSAAPC
jgi:hypothetical protein